MSSIYSSLSSSLPISIINLICEYASHLDDTPWMPVFDENTHDMKQAVNKYCSQHTRVANRILDRKCPQTIRLRFNMEFLFFDIFIILAYPSIKYYLRNIAHNFVIFYSHTDGKTKGTAFVNNQHYPLGYAGFSQLGLEVFTI